MQFIGGLTSIFTSRSSFATETQKNQKYVGCSNLGERGCLVPVPSLNGSNLNCAARSMRTVIYPFVWTAVKGVKNTGLSFVKGAYRGHAGNLATSHTSTIQPSPTRKHSARLGRECFAAYLVGRLNFLNFSLSLNPQ
jgi:hypothetical protein